jgi:intracellular septation protein A
MRSDTPREAQGANRVKPALIQLADDFVSAISFVVVFAWTGNLVVACLTAIVVAIGQALYGVTRNKPWTAMRWMALALAIFLGGLTLLTHDSRFIRIKPSLAHFAIGAVMLKPGWQMPYLPELVRTLVPRRQLLGWGYAWAALMFAMGILNLIAAYALSVPAWSVVVTLLLIGKLGFFLLQYAVLRITVRRLRAQA